MKALRRTLVVAGCLVVLLAGASAAGAVDLYVNGNLIVTQPAIVIHNDLSYGPVRAVGEALGGHVDWQPGHVEASVCLGNKCVRFQFTEGLIRGGRLFVPIRMLAERLGATVQWNDRGAVPRIDISLPPA
jgi:hypothetical protein